MAMYRVCGATTINVYLDIEADSLEEAIELAEDNANLVEYCDGSLGIYCDYDGNISENGWFEWYEEYSEEI